MKIHPILKIYYPVLLGVFSSISLINQNIHQLWLWDCVPILVLTTIFSILIYSSCNLIIKNVHKAAVISTLFFICIFGYGHIYNVLNRIIPIELNLARHRLIFPVWIILFILSGWLILKHGKKLEKLSHLMNIVSIILLVFPVLGIVSFTWRRNYLLSTPQDHLPTLPSYYNFGSFDYDYPDIYYIVLDAYPRSDILEQYHNFNNRYFTDQLETLGFYIPKCSQSNYGLTMFSLASSLTMDYLKGFKDEILTKRDERTDAIHVFQVLENNETMKILERYGYQTISFESGYWLTEFRNSDRFISQENTIISSFDLTHPSEFELLFIRTTIFSILETLPGPAIREYFQNAEKQNYERVLFEFSELENITELAGPKFVIAHIMAPHSSPYLFSNDGTFSPSSSNEAFGREIYYLNRRILSLVKNIIGSEKRAIIIIQSDHGLDWDVRMANFTAIYFPTGGYEHLYNSMTPVNLFRIIFNSFFGYQFSLLPDISYFSPSTNETQYLYPCLP